MRKNTFITTNKRFGEVLERELSEHCIPVGEFREKCRFNHTTFSNIKKG